MKQSKFVISTRRDTILTYLHNHGTAKVDELSVLCGVSPLTTGGIWTHWSSPIWLSAILAASS